MNSFLSSIPLPVWASFSVYGHPPFAFKAPNEVLATGLSFHDAKSLVAQYTEEAERRGQFFGFGSMSFGLERESVRVVKLKDGNPHVGDLVVWSYEEPTQHQHVVVEKSCWGDIRQVNKGSVLVDSVNGESFVCHKAVGVIPCDQFTDSAAARNDLLANWQHVPHFDLGALCRIVAPHRRINPWRAPDSQCVDFIERNNDSSIQKWLARLAA